MEELIRSMQNSINELSNRVVDLTIENQRLQETCETLRRENQDLGGKILDMEKKMSQLEFAKRIRDVEKDPNFDFDKILEQLERGENPTPPLNKED